MKMSKVEIEKNIASIGRRGALLDKDIQATGLAVLAHIEDHREVSLFKKLFDAMPKGSRRNALVAWAVGYGQVAVNMDKATKAAQPFLFNKEKKADLKAASEKAWFDFKKEKEPAEAFSFETELEAFQKKVKAWVKAGKISEQDPAVAAIIATKATPKEVTVADLEG